MSYMTKLILIFRSIKIPLKVLNEDITSLDSPESELTFDEMDLTF